MFAPVGEVRRDIFTDSLLFDLGQDTFVVPCTEVAKLTSHRARSVAVSRRYWGDTPGKFSDHVQGIRLARSPTNRDLVLVMVEGIFTVPIAGVLEVKDAIHSACTISRVLTTERRAVEVEA